MNKKQTVHSSASDDLRPKIVAAARARFKQYGYAKTSMQEIAADCDMSAANLYRFYEGKQDIGAAVVRDLQADLLGACDRAVASAEPGAKARLIALLQCVIDGTRHQIRREPLLFELRLTAPRENPELRRSYLR